MAKEESYNLIAVLDDSCQTVDIIKASENKIAEYGGVEPYLIEHCGYNPDEIQWLDCIQSIDHYTDKSFAN